MRHLTVLLLVGLSVLSSSCTSGPPASVNPLFPRIHYTPACYYNQGGPHDIAATLYVNGTYHIMAGCWSCGGWQHLISTDLVTWTEVGRPESFGGTGGMIQDDDGTVVAYAMGGGALKFWVASDDTASNWTLTNTSVPSCCNDPIVWKAAGSWFAVTASHGSGKGPNFGLEAFYTSPTLLGPHAKWSQLSQPLFTNKASLLVPGHPQQKEFVSPDYFEAIPGATDPDAAVFLTSTYGNIGQVSGVPQKGIYNYAVLFSGSQPGGPGTPFVSHHTQAVDWSPFIPSNTTQGGLDLAYDWGPTQLGCCPKTVPGPELAPGRPRRVMFGWLQNGGSDGNAAHCNSKENTLSLPRDLSLAPDGSVLQRFVPELQRLRSSQWQASSLSFPAAGGAAGAVALPGAASGRQLEIEATITFPEGSSTFGLLVLSGKAEHTAIGFDALNGQVFVDRTLSSGGALDTDIRAGPWPNASHGSVQLHAYVDRSIVSFIVDNRTALSVWVHPTQGAASAGVALFASSPGVVANKLAVWQLHDAHT